MLSLVLSTNISNYVLDKKKQQEMWLIRHQPTFMQTNRRFYLISKDKKLSNQFSVHFLIISDK